MRRKATWFLIPTLGLALAVGTAWSLGWGNDLDPMGGGRHAKRVSPMMPMLDDPALREQLGLTDEQASQLRGLLLDAAKAGIRARSDLMIHRLELNELLRVDKPDRAAIDRKVRQLSDAHHALLKNRVEHRLAVHQLLTPEQRSRMRTLLRQHRRRHGHERRPRHRPRGGSFGPRGGFDPVLEPQELPLE